MNMRSVMELSRPPSLRAASNALRTSGRRSAESRIGPNAITQLHSLLIERVGPSETRELFEGAGLEAMYGDLPSDMVDEEDVARLHQEVRWRYTSREAQEFMTEAGDRTGRYILEHRIPAPIRFVLRRLPPALSSRLLTMAIRRHAWTFAGSGRFTMTRAGGGTSPIVARIERNPVVALETSAGPICAWHAAVFRRLFRELVSENCSVRETDCCAAGAPACRFEIGED